MGTHVWGFRLSIQVCVCILTCSIQLNHPYPEYLKTQTSILNLNLDLNSQTWILNLHDWTSIPEPQYLTQILNWMWILNVSTLYLSANLHTQILILNLNTWMWIPDMTTWIWYWMWVPKHKPEYWAWIPKHECPYLTTEPEHLNLNTWTQTPGIWLFDGLVI